MFGRLFALLAWCTCENRAESTLVFVVHHSYNAMVWYCAEPRISTAFCTGFLFAPASDAPYLGFQELNFRAEESEEQLLRLLERHEMSEAVCILRAETLSCARYLLSNRLMEGGWGGGERACRKRPDGELSSGPTEDREWEMHLALA